MLKRIINMLNCRKLKKLQKTIFDPVTELRKFQDVGFTASQALQIMNYVENRLSRK